MDTQFQQLQTLFQQATSTLNTSQLLQCTQQAQNIISNLEILDYLMISKPVTFPKKKLIETLTILGFSFKLLFELYSQQQLTQARIKTTRIENSINTQQSQFFQSSLKAYSTILQIIPEQANALKNIVSLYSIKSLLQQYDYPSCIENFQHSLSHHPTDPTTHYNIGFIYLKLNQLNQALYHYKLAIKLNEPDNINLFLNCYYGIASVYRTVKQWPQALHYLLQGLKYKSTDPDINNQLGVIYTELRRTDLALNCYNTALNNVQTSIISTDLTFLHAEILLNRGHMESYNGNIEQSIEFYNQSLQKHPTFLLPFQNKIMNLNYLFDIIEDKEYIYKQHLCISRIIPSTPRTLPLHKTTKWNIGFVSGDFVDHPVSYFIKPFLNHFDHHLFNIFCYSENVVSSKEFDNTIQFHVIKNKSDPEASQFIQSHQIHILFDLSGHTAMNRIGIFSLRSAPIQISYIGYPNTTGIPNMDYRITDLMCDSPIIKNRYIEKLLFLNRCFLCYDITIDNFKPSNNSPFLTNGYITFGCFNRLNKIGHSVIHLWKQLLEFIPNSRILFKTKALLNPHVKTNFLNHFPESFQNRIDIIDCTVTHQQHLEIYNQIDFSIDTFPYSGTTTSCESLVMGVPPLTIQDTIHHFHAQNVTHSILTHSGLQQYSFQNINTLIQNVKNFLQWDSSTWKTLKYTTHTQFINSSVCNQKEFTKELQTTLLQLIQ